MFTDLQLGVASLFAEASRKGTGRDPLGSGFQEKKVSLDGRVRKLLRMGHDEELRGAHMQWIAAWREAHPEASTRYKKRPTTR